MTSTEWKGHSLKDLEKAYNEASKGKSCPNVMIIYCGTCDVCYQLLKDEDNIICEHLEKIFRK